MERRRGLIAAMNLIVACGGGIDPSDAASKSHPERTQAAAPARVTDTSQHAVLAAGRGAAAESLETGRRDERASVAGRPMQLIFTTSTDALSARTFHALQQHMEEMARQLARMDRRTPLWDSMRGTGLELEIQGWHFVFAVEPDALVLVDVWPAPPATP